MRLFVGLGNPGAKYQGTRHNIGFQLLDLLWEQAPQKGSWRTQFKGDVAEILIKGNELGGEKSWLLKPMTFMNLSGESVVAAAQFWKVEVEDIVVVHDDIDLELGVIRLKQGGGDGGHNGIKSVATLLGSKDFIRLRLGVGKNAHYDSSDWVLGRFDNSELETVRGMLERGSEALVELTESGLLAAQNKFNR